MDTNPVNGGASQFVALAGDSLDDVLGDEHVFGDESLRELWDIWSEYESEFGEAMLLTIPEWFSESEFGKSRPFLLGSVEYDDPSSGAVLFSDCRLINKSIVVNRALTRAETVTLEDAIESNKDSHPDSLVDISADNDYIDESGKMWIPRSQMQVFEKVA